MATTPPAMLTISITQPATATVLIHIAISNRVSDNTNRRMPPYIIKLKFGQRLRRCNVHLCSSLLLIRYSPDELWNGVDDSTDGGIRWILGGRPVFPGWAALRPGPRGALRASGWRLWPGRRRPQRICRQLHQSIAHSCLRMIFFESRFPRLSRGRSVYEP